MRTLLAFSRGWMPPGSVPMKFPSILLLSVPRIGRAEKKRVIESPRTTLSLAAILSPAKILPECSPPSSLMRRSALLPTALVFLLAPGWVYPSMITGSIMSGRDVLPGEMVHTPESQFGAVVGMLKWMRSGPPELAVELAALIASRKVHPPASHVPLPGSKVLLTVKVVTAWAGLAARNTPS